MMWCSLLCSLLFKLVVPIRNNRPFPTMFRFPCDYGPYANLSLCVMVVQRCRIVDIRTGLLLGKHVVHGLLSSISRIFEDRFTSSLLKTWEQPKLRLF